MGDVVKEIRCDGSFVSLEAGIVVLGVGSSRIFQEVGVSFKAADFR